MNLSPYLTKKETAEFLRCTERHVDRLRATGRLETIRLAGSTKAVRLKREEVAALAR
jgi:excisionase family DNA binding protein